MTTQTEVGISPVLLQAITQQLADPNADPDKVTQVKAFCDENGQQKIVFCRPEGPVILKQEQSINVMEGNHAHAEGMVMTGGLDGSGHVIKTEQLVDEGGDLVIEDGMRHVIMGQPVHVNKDQNPRGDFVVVSRESETGLKDGQYVVVRSASHSQERVIATTSEGRLTLAPPGDVGRQTFRESRVEEKDQKIYIRVPQGVPRNIFEQQPVATTVPSSSEMSMGSVLSAIASHHARLKQDSVPGTQSIEVPTSQSEDGDSNPQQIIIYTQEMPVAASDIAVANSEVIISESGQGDMPLPVKRQCVEGEHLILVNDSAEAMNCVQGDMIPYSERSGPSPWTNYVQQFSAKGPCPICGDKVSGYHYGIYCCESCKGFFKRTVQNKKTFACHRKDDCDVLIASRKKCPSCRFKKCVMMGMKVGAVRGDRARGGRSVYDGCSPHLKRKLSYQDNKAHASGSRGKGESESYVQSVPTAVTETTVIATQSGETLPIPSALVDILSSSKSAENEATDVIKPLVPQVVTEIMNLESILCEEEEEQTFQPEEENFYTSLLQIADQRLYKIVRWARSLPDFAIISTDDQILLLQSAWADLLCLDCCWRSLQTPNEIKLSYCKSINLDVAREIGAEEIVDRMLQLTQHLHRIQLDMSEFACLKVLILMTPDVKGLKDISHIRSYQEKVTDALMVYSTTHYPHHANKFGELLLRLPEIAKTSCIGKEMLGKKDLPAEISSFSLLMELLKTNPPTS